MELIATFVELTPEHMESVKELTKKFGGRYTVVGSVIDVHLHGIYKDIITFMLKTVDYGKFSFKIK